MTHDDYGELRCLQPGWQVCGLRQLWMQSTARVWEAATGKEVARMTHDDSGASVAFSPDGRYVVSEVGDGTARVWEAPQAKKLLA